MALSPISASVRMPSRPVSSAKPKREAQEATQQSSSTATPARQLLPSDSLADVLARHASGYSQASKSAQISATSTQQSIQTTTGKVSVNQRFVDTFSAAAADPQGFRDLLTTAFGNDFDMAQAEGFRQSALRGDFSFLPSVEYVNASVLHGANGAYSASNNTIFINESLRGTELGAQTFVEEAGHFLDNRLNTCDSLGDEGELFRRLLNGESLSAQDIATIRSDDDAGSIIVNGESHDVEFWSLGGFLGDIGDSIGDAVSGIADGVSNVVNSVVDTVGDAVSNVAETVGDMVTGAADTVGNIISSTGHVVGGMLSGAGDWIGGGVGDFMSSSGAFLSDASDSAGGFISNGVSWLNNNVFQPAINTGVEFVQDVVPIATGIVGFPLQVFSNAISGAGSTLQSLLEGDFSGAWDNFLNTAQDLLVAPLELVVTTVALSANAGINAVNNALGLTEERGLNQAEIDYLRPIFGDSINYNSIRIQSGGIKEALGISPQTTGNDIFLQQDWGGDIFNEDGTLTEAGLHLLGHEAGHVWQYQNGGISYVGDALITQALDAVGIGDGYSIRDALQQGLAFEDMNPEQQASVAEYIGIAMENNNGQLTALGFSNAAGFGDVLSNDEFAIVQTAHDLLRQ